MLTPYDLLLMTGRPTFAKAKSRPQASLQPTPEMPAFVIGAAAVNAGHFLHHQIVGTTYKERAASAAELWAGSFMRNGYRVNGRPRMATLNNGQIVRIYNAHDLVEPLSVQVAERVPPHDIIFPLRVWEPDALRYAELYTSAPKFGTDQHINEDW